MNGRFFAVHNQPSLATLTIKHSQFG